MSFSTSQHRLRRFGRLLCWLSSWLASLGKLTSAGWSSGFGPKFPAVAWLELPHVLRSAQPTTSAPPLHSAIGQMLPLPRQIGYLRRLGQTVVLLYTFLTT